MKASPRHLKRQRLKWFARYVGERLPVFVPNANTVAIYDAKTGKITSTLRIRIEEKHFEFLLDGKKITRQKKESHAQWMRRVFPSMSARKTAALPFWMNWADAADEQPLWRRALLAAQADDWEELKDDEGEAGLIVKELTEKMRPYTNFKCEGNRAFVETLFDEPRESFMTSASVKFDDGGFFHFTMSKKGQHLLKVATHPNDVTKTFVRRLDDGEWIPPEKALSVFALHATHWQSKGARDTGTNNIINFAQGISQKDVDKFLELYKGKGGYLECVDTEVETKQPVMQNPAPYAVYAPMPEVRRLQVPIYLKPDIRNAPSLKLQDLIIALELYHYNGAGESTKGCYDKMYRSGLDAEMVGRLKRYDLQQKSFINHGRAAVAERDFHSMHTLTALAAACCGNLVCRRDWEQREIKPGTHSLEISR